jgi:uncharacterized protein (DUF362 family)
MSDEQKNLSRREFISRTAKAAAAIAATGIVSAVLYDGKGPSGEITDKELVTIPDFSIPQKSGQVMSIVKGSDRVKTADKAIDLLGGIERFVSAGDIVVIKPNVAFATVPALGATSNPELIAEVVHLCYSRGKAKKVYVTDNPINNPSSCFDISGIGKAASLAGAGLILPKESYFKRMTLEGGELIRDCQIFYEPLARANKLIGIAPVKSHSRAAASMTMKNWYGLLGSGRNIFHQKINTIITELSILIKPTLVILDGTEVMMTNGPTGGSFSDLKRVNTLIASCDAVAADSFGCSLLGLKVTDLPYLQLAQKAGAGSTDYESLKPVIAELG